MNEFFSPKCLFAFGLSTLINTMISAFGTPIGPVIAALLFGIALGGFLMRHQRADS